MRTLRPVCNPTPDALIKDLKVRCRSMGSADQQCCIGITVAASQF
jgi:hypothetical protein